MTIDWHPLRQELSLWQEQGLSLPFWWRDDDAIEPSQRLEKLLQISGDTGLPVHLAVIPAFATAELADNLAARENAVPIVHGYAHQNHSPEGQKKSEYGPDRPENQVSSDISQGRSAMEAVFKARFAPMFVPPWNRFSPKFYPALTANGYQAVSTFTPRSEKFAAKELLQINTHLDPIDWHGSRSCHLPETLVSQTVNQLQQRRAGVIDTQEPFGLLTHHLVHDDAIWNFTRDFIETMLCGPVTFWNARSLKGTKI